MEGGRGRCEETVGMCILRSWTRGEGERGEG